MERCEFRLMWMLLLYGVVSLVLISITIPSTINVFIEANEAFTGSAELTVFQLVLVVVIVAQAVFAVGAAVYSFIQKTVMHKFALISAVMLLFAFPVGTALGAYYLWFWFQYKGVSGVVCQHGQN